MELKEYAQVVADGLGGKVIEVEKPNKVILTGVQFGEVGNIQLTFYVNDYFENDVPVDEAIDRIKKAAEKNNNKERIAVIQNVMENVHDLNKIKDNFKARLFNESCNFDVSISAAKYGFDDLIIVPYIELNNEMSVRITDQMIKLWNVSKDEVIKIAMENTADDVEIENLLEMLKRMDMPVPDIELEYVPTQLVVTNKNKSFGSIAIIFAKEKISHIFPEGYAVIPSSVHEVIVISKAGDAEEINRIIGDVNDTTLIKQDQLGNHAYIF